MAVDGAGGGVLAEDGVDDAGGKEAGEQGAQGSTGAMDAEGVQGVVVAEEALDDEDHEEAEGAGDKADGQGHMGWTKPEAGVMATSPATAPEMAPRAVGLPL